MKARRAPPPRGIREQAARAARVERVNTSVWGTDDMMQ